MSNSGKIALAILIGFGILIFLGIGASQPISKTNPNEPLVDKNELNKQAFIGGCNPDGKTLSYCTCVWDKMDARYSDSEIEAVSVEYSQTKKMPQAVVDYIKDCAELYQTELESV